MDVVAAQEGAGRGRVGLLVYDKAGGLMVVEEQQLKDVSSTCTAAAAVEPYQRWCGATEVDAYMYFGQYERVGQAKGNIIGSQISLGWFIGCGFGDGARPVLNPISFKIDIRSPLCPPHCAHPGEQESEVEQLARALDASRRAEAEWQLRAGEAAVAAQRAEGDAAGVRAALLQAEGVVGGRARRPAERGIAGASTQPCSAQQRRCEHVALLSTASQVQARSPAEHGNLPPFSLLSNFAPY
eukprot:365100-Chlamydomonas_euryale.AAC.14